MTPEQTSEQIADRPPADTGKCPFYAHALVQPGKMIPSVIPRTWILYPNPGSNQCALITHAHSPCIMTINDIDPVWEECTRNPWIAEGL